MDAFHFFICGDICINAFHINSDIRLDALMHCDAFNVNEDIIMNAFNSQLDIVVGCIWIIPSAFAISGRWFMSHVFWRIS